MKRYKLIRQKGKTDSLNVMSITGSKIANNNFFVRAFGYSVNREI
jgi:hypothetical protein